VAYTLPTLVSYLRIGTAAAITGTIVATGAQTPFQISPSSGNYWGQVTFQAVNNAVTTFTADLEIDMTGVDANFVILIAGQDFESAPATVLNLSGGNIRYRWNVKTWTGTGAVIYVIAG
jgi:hypothetical protein